MNKENKYIQSIKTLMDEGLEARAVKYHKGHDGCEGVNANIYHKNKKVAEVHDDAWGGCLEIRYTARGPHRHDKEGPSFRSEINRIKDSLEPYPWEIEGATIDGLCEWDEDHIYNKLIEIHDNKKRLNRLLKNNILYVTEGKLKSCCYRQGGKKVPIRPDHIERFMEEEGSDGVILNEKTLPEALLLWMEYVER